MKKILLTASAVALAIASTGAFAADGQGFIRGEIGRTQFTTGYSSVSSLTSKSQSDTSFSLRGGYMFTPNVGLEGFYSRLYNKSGHYPDGTRFNSGLNALGLGVVGKVRFGDQAAPEGFFASGRLGVARLSNSFTTYNNSFTGGSYHFSKGSTDPYVGVGVGYDFSAHHGLSLNYDHIRSTARENIGGYSYRYRANANTLALGYQYSF